MAKETDEKGLFDNQETRVEIFNAIASDHQLMMDFMQVAKENEHGREITISIIIKNLSTMKYYIKKTISTEFDKAIELVTEALKTEGFGVLSEIDIKQKFKEKLDIAFRNYKILGACNPPSAYKALQHDDKIGVLLPCNVIIQELGNNKIEIAAVDPAASMMTVDNKELAYIAGDIKAKLERVIASL